MPQQSVKTFGDLLVWSEGERIYVAGARKRKPGNSLSVTPLKRVVCGSCWSAMVRPRKTPRALHDRIILVGGGGDGFHWAPARQPSRPG